MYWALGLSFSSAAFAEDAAVTCDSGTLAKLNDQLDRLVDPALKEKVDAARAELINADKAMKASKTEDCVAALKKSLGIVPGTPSN